jgi:putative hydrolase of the HAD superfamily
MSISTVVFDFGNVIGYFSHRRAAEQLAALSARAATADEVLAAFHDRELEDAFESGRLSSAEVLALLRRRFHLQGSDAEITRAFVDMFTPNREACELVPLLQPRYRLVLLSNTNELHYRHIHAQFGETLRHFHALVASHEVGARKPSRAIYERARELAGGPPAAECLFVDDLPANVEAARACGWRGIVYGKGDDLRRLLLGAGVGVAA